MDKDTAKQVSRTDEIVAMTKGNGWQYVRQDLLSKIAVLDDISQFDKLDGEAIIQELGAKQMAKHILLDWLRKVEGEKFKKEDYQESLKKIKSDDYISHFD